MTDPHDPDLQRLDAVAREAASGLHAHVLPRVDADLALARVPASSPRRTRHRVLGAAAAIAVLVGSVAVLSDRNGEGDRSRLELDEDGNALPTPQPGTLTALAPHDGKDSIQLPLTVTPSAEGLHDGDTVTVSAPGFAPGESVGLVQCAQEAGGETREQRGGIDACDISPYTSITADENGVAVGEYQVQRILTTPLTGTVDCASAAERCLVAMGALSDYDRSGGYGITFASDVAAEDPGLAIPTLVVTPADGLSDGDVVHVEGAGYTPGAEVGVQVCAKDPAGCWSTGEALPLALDPAADCFDLCLPYGLAVTSDGLLSGDVPVWRFLPGTEPGTYIDCAVSECTLRLTTSDALAPAPAPLGFVGGGSGPIPPAVAVDPDTDLEVGQTVVVRGAGFNPASYVSINLCISDAEGVLWGCLGGGDGEQPLVGEDGTFAIEFEVPDPTEFGQYDEVSATTTACGDGLPCPAAPGAPTCGVAPYACSIRVEAYSEESVLRPSFPPAPVPVTFRSGG